MDDIKKKNKIKLTLPKILLAIGLFLWLCIALFFFYRIPDIKKSSPEDEARVIMQDTATVPDLEQIKGLPVAGVDVMTIGFPSDQLIKQGEQTFKNTCASCHGEQGKGDGAGGASLNPKPRNFHALDGWKNGRNIAAMFKTVTEGIPGSAMTAYEFLPAEDRFAVIHFIRNLVGGFPDISKLELADINNIYDLGSARLSASQIPVKLAKENYLKDKSLQKALIGKMCAAYDKNNGDEIKLIRSVISNKEKAFTTIIENAAMESQSRFISVISTNIGSNGFKAEILHHSKDDIMKIYQKLKAII